MSTISLIQPQRVDFDTTQISDWLDGLPMIGRPSLGGSLAGAENAGNGSLTVADVAAGSAYGAHIVTVTGVAGGQTRISVVDPAGRIEANGVVGLPLYAAGLTLTLTQGSAPFVVGDSFAIAVLPAPLDLTGLIFELDARDALGARTFALFASSGGDDPTIANGGIGGTIAMAVPRAVMGRLRIEPKGYPYSITAFDPAEDRRVVAFYGFIFHAANAATTGAI